MKILETKVLRGPNYWSIKRQKLIQLTIDLEDLEEKPTHTIPGFYERLQQLLPSLYEHQCSEGHRGGFFERVKDGTWMGHVIEHLALELQSLAGITVGFGRTRGTGAYGVYHVVYEYDEEDQGLYSGMAAIRLAEAIIHHAPFDVAAEVRKIKRRWFCEKPGPSTSSLVNEAIRRNIPVLKLDHSVYQLGYGCKQKRIEATITSNTSTIAVDIACDKNATKRILQEAFIPTPPGKEVKNITELESAIREIGYPVVLKPLDGNHGNGATIDVNDWHEAQAAFLRAVNYSDSAIVEKYITGQDFRVLVVNNKFVAAALRKPAFVTGDGTKTIQQLIDELNDDDRRGEAHENYLTRIKADEVTAAMLKKSGYDLRTVLPAGKEVLLKPTANLSTGGTATDVTDAVHPHNIKLCERVARIIGLDICGIDIIAPDLSTPLQENGGAVIEVNAAPGFRMHLEPTHGTPRNVAAPVMDMLFKNHNGRIPIVAVTGTNGKTTTTRLVAHIAGQSGLCTGYTTTDGIYINNELIKQGDCSGPTSAQFILKDSSVEFAVLETARGGLLRSGLGFDRCDCAIITNVAGDHLGIDGIDTLEKLAKAKAVIAETVAPTGYAILNADDDLVYAMKDRLACKIALFSVYSDSIRIEQHCAQGGIAAVYENGYLLLRIANHFIPIEEVTHVPVTFNGKADFNIANILAACLAAYVSKIKLKQIREAIRSFSMSYESTPGRMNFYEFHDYSVLVDYAHNPHGLEALGRFIATTDTDCKTGIITGVGDRRDEDIVKLGEVAAKIFDEIIIRHDKDLRGRTAEEIDRLLTTGIRKVDQIKPLIYIDDECEALKLAVKLHRTNSLIVVLTEKIESVTACLKELKTAENDIVLELKPAV